MRGKFEIIAIQNFLFNLPHISSFVLFPTFASKVANKKGEMMEEIVLNDVAKKLC